MFSCSVSFPGYRLQKDFRSSCLYVCVCVCVLVTQSCPTLCDPWTVTSQAPLSMEFFRQKQWSELRFLAPGDLPGSEIKSGSLALQADSLLSEPPGKPPLPLELAIGPITTKTCVVALENRQCNTHTYTQSSHMFSHHTHIYPLSHNTLMHMGTRTDTHSYTHL